MRTGSTGAIRGGCAQTRVIARQEAPRWRKHMALAGALAILAALLMAHPAHAGKSTGYGAFAPCGLDNGGRIKLKGKPRPEEMIEHASNTSSSARLDKGRCEVTKKRHSRPRST